MARRDRESLRQKSIYVEFRLRADVHFAIADQRHRKRQRHAGQIARAGLRVACELEDPLPLAVHRFFAVTPSARALATAKWTVRAGLHRLAPSVARRVFTVHYACLCLPDA